ncbi:MAG TPA: NHL repeat-containing protein [Chloroflexota bacterium]|nr:NHL repeat-containing protein [Chloroflexota bacterium]
MRPPAVFLVSALLLLVALPSGMPTAGVLAAPLPGSWQVLGAARTLPTLYRPGGVTVDSIGHVYVADSGNFRVVEMGPHGRLLAHFGEADLRPGPGAPRPTGGQETLGPRSLAVDAHGTVYVADSLNRYIRVFSPQHHLVGDWPISVPDATVLQLAVALGGRGNVIIAIDARVNCSARLGPTYCATYYVVQRRSPAGTVIGQFHSPIGISGQTPTTQSITQLATAVDRGGDIYVALDGVRACYKDCSSFHFLIKHASGGKVLARWGAEELDVSATWPALAIGARWMVLADDFNHRVEKRSLGGKIMARWALSSLVPPLQTGPGGVAVDRHENIYAADPGAGRILKLSPTGRLLAVWGTGGSESGRFWFPGSVVLDPRGRLWVDDVINGRVQMLASDGRFHVEFAVPHAGPAMALDRQGTIYIGQLVDRAVYISKFSPSGKLLARLGPLPADVLALGLRPLPGGIAVAPNGDVFVAGDFCPPAAASSGPPCGENVLHLDSRGRQVGAIPISNDATGSGIAVDAQENVYLAYGAPAARFEKWSRTGVLLASWGNPTPTYSSPSPAGITLDSAGNLYVANTPQSVIEEFGPTGTLLRTWGFHGSYPGQFQHPGGIAVSPNGTIYVADTDNHRIQTMKP